MRLLGCHNGVRVRSTPDALGQGLALAQILVILTSEAQTSAITGIAALGVLFCALAWRGQPRLAWTSVAVSVTMFVLAYLRVHLTAPTHVPNPPGIIVSVAAVLAYSMCFNRASRAVSAWFLLMLLLVAALL